MTIATIPSQEFIKHVERAKKATRAGPVIITERGEPAYVLLSIESYTRLAGPRRSVVDALSMPGLSDIDLDFRLPGSLPRAADFSS